MDQNDLRLIEAGFPCHQVGAETQRERGASSALPPLYYLHVWWARRPLTPSRAAILASLLPADADPDAFIRSLGIRPLVALIGDERWTLTNETITKRLVRDDSDAHRWLLPIDQTVLSAVEKERERRELVSRTVIASSNRLDPTMPMIPWSKLGRPRFRRCRTFLLSLVTPSKWSRRQLILRKSRAIKEKMSVCEAG